LVQERKRKLIKLALVAVVVDLATTLFELPFMAFTIGTITVEEIVEQIISTLIARNEIQLTVTDRVIGMIPIPGITPVTVRVIRELLKS
jgi:hypothetical protein